LIKADLLPEEDKDNNKIDLNSIESGNFFKIAAND
jgi:hypothetical protein